VSLLQVRYPVLLTPVEKQMAREVCVAFGQAVSARFFLSFNTTSFFSLSLREEEEDCNNFFCPFMQCQIV
jgi:hypothetical protein